MRALTVSLVLASAAGALALLAGTHAAAQSYPSRPVRIITAGAGSGVDYVARMVAPGLSPRLGQAVVVENRSSGLITVDTVAKAPPDGYTILVYGSTVWITPLVQKTPYDPLTDLAPITLIGNLPLAIAVHPSMPIFSVKDLIAVAKARPGSLNDGSLGTGTAGHLGGELFKAMAGVDIVRVPYKSGAQQLADLFAGQVQLAFITAASAAPHVKAGKIRVIAVTSARPSSLVPGVPPVAETLSGYEAGARYVMFAPANTPAAIIGRLNRESIQFLKEPDTKDKLANAGVDIVGSAPEELGGIMKSEMARLAKLIKDANIQIQE